MDEKLVRNFKKTIDNWNAQLDQFSFAQLIVVPSNGGWSIGQVYMHLSEATTHFLKQIRICASDNEDENEEASINAKVMFSNNNFPDLILEGPPSNAYSSQTVKRNY